MGVSHVATDRGSGCARVATIDVVRGSRKVTYNDGGGD